MLWWLHLLKIGSGWAEKSTSDCNIDVMTVKNTDTSTKERKEGQKDSFMDYCDNVSRLDSAGEGAN